MPPSSTAATATATTALTTPAERGGREYAAVTGAWAMAVVASAISPLDDPRVSRAALVIHVMAMAIGFGAVIMIDVYGLLWLFGYRNAGVGKRVSTDSA